MKNLADLLTLDCVLERKSGMVLDGYIAFLPKNGETSLRNRDFWPEP